MQENRACRRAGEVRLGRLMANDKVTTPRLTASVRLE